MDTETLIIVIGFVWGAYMLYKIHKRRQQSRDPAAGVLPQQKQTIFLLVVEPLLL